MIRSVVAAIVLAASLGLGDVSAQNTESKSKAPEARVDLHIGIGPFMAVGIALERAVPRPSGKIAVVNIRTVFAKYEKAKELKVKFEAQTGKYIDSIFFDRLEKDLLEYKKRKRQANGHQNDDELDQVIKRIADRKRAINDPKWEFRRLKTKEAQELAKVWTEVTDTAEKLAKAEGFALILSYDDPPDPKETLKFRNLNRKMQAMDQGGLTPLFVDPRCDITDRVIRQLNRAYGNARSKAPAPPPAARQDNTAAFRLHFAIEIGPLLALNFLAPRRPEAETAFANVGTLFTKYQKATEFKRNLCEQATPYKEKMDRWYKEMKEYQKLLAEGDPSHKPEYLQEEITVHPTNACLVS